MSETRFTLRCERIRADKPNLNGRVYPRSVLESMVEGAQTRINQRRLMGRLGASAERIRIMDVSHLVTEMRITEDGHIEAEIEVLPQTPNGKTLMTALALGGAKNYEVIPTGTGSTRQLDAATTVVNDDYRLSALDIVLKVDAPAGRPYPTGPIYDGPVATLRVPVIVDEQGNCYTTGWFHANSEYPDPGWGDMEEQARDCHLTSFLEEAPKTVVTRWVTIKVPIPQSETEIAETFHAEPYEEADA